MMQRFEEQPRELYTIPITSSWFNWDTIHDVERKSLPEFFDSSSYSRNPRVYKEYRDFIISKFREDPSRRLTFTEVRKSLIGDVGSVEKVFSLLDQWGLINFGVKSEEKSAVEEEGGPAVVVEEGLPAGVKVVAAAGSGGGSGGGGSGFRLPAFSSYLDVFGDSTVGKGPVCGGCGEQCKSGQFESNKGGYALCSKCFGTKNIAEEKSRDDLKPKNHAEGSDDQANTAWTDAETLLLLEAVLKHGEDWDLIAQHVRTKNKLECIARLINLPFGEHMLGSIRSKLDNRNSGIEVTKVKEPQHVQSEEPIKIDDGQHTDIEEQQYVAEDGNEQKNLAEESTPERPAKRRCLPSLSDSTDSLTKQVALLSTVAGPHIAATAAEAAVTALCRENPCAQKAFEIDEDESAHKFGLSINHELKSDLKFEDQDIKRDKQSDLSPEKSFGATTFRIRAAIATSFGAAAARAKLLADQEEREMELLVASVIETQMKKIEMKMKHFEELEVIMEKEYEEIQHLKGSILEEWSGILQQAFDAGISKWRDNGFPKLLLNTNL